MNSEEEIEDISPPIEDLHDADGEAISGLAADMDQIEVDSPQATQNETSISDNNGDRIELGEDPEGVSHITK